VYTVLSRSSDSSVGIATGYGLADPQVGVPVPALGPTQPPIQWVPGALYQAVKQLGREADHSHQVSAEVKKMWIYTSTPRFYGGMRMEAFRKNFNYIDRHLLLGTSRVTSPIEDRIIYWIKIVGKKYFKSLCNILTSLSCRKYDSMITPLASELNNIHPCN
jgi:hypothetical protein